MASNNFWELIKEYRASGFDPIRWVPTLSSEIDPRVFDLAVQEIKRSSIKVTPSWFDSFYYMDGKVPEVTRRIYSFDQPQVDKEVEVKRAISIFRVLKNTGEDAALFSLKMQDFLKAFHAKVSVSKTTISLTEHPEAQFGMFDYIELHRGDKVGYTAATNTITQATDITQQLDAKVHSDIAMTSAIENLNILGCLPSSYKIFPVYDAPSEEMLDRIRTNLDLFTSRYNLPMEDYSSLKMGKLFYGSSAIANTLKELPTRYDEVHEGMEIIITKQFGSLIPLSLHTQALMDDTNIAKFEQNGIPMNSLAHAKEDTIKSLAEPHFSLGKIIAKYCPDFGMPFDRQSHIVAVYPVLAEGISALGRLAELTNSHLVINEIPVMYEEMARFATKEALVDNATSSANGTHLIVTSKDVGALVKEDLRKHNFEPETIGFISKKGSPAVAITTDVGHYVASKARIARLKSLQSTNANQKTPSQPAAGQA